MRANAPQLQYVPASPWHRRRAIRRLVVLSVLLVTAAFAARRWGPLAWRQSRLYWAQRQCMAYVASPKQRVYASDPNPDAFTRATAKAITTPPPKCWVALGASLPQTMALPKDAELGLDGSFDSLAPSPVFLHGRSTGGKVRLVVVEFGEQALGGKMHRVLCWRVIRPATLLHGPVLLWEGSTIIVSSFQWTAAVRVYAGQADESDPAHFTVDADVDGERERIDGWLQDDDTVKLQVPEGPAKLP